MEIIEAVIALTAFLIALTMKPKETKVVTKAVRRNMARHRLENWGITKK